MQQSRIGFSILVAALAIGGAGCWRSAEPVQPATATGVDPGSTSWRSKTRARSPLDPVVREAREAIARYDALARTCRGAPDLGCAATLAASPDPCGRPRSVPGAGLSQRTLDGEHVAGQVFFDGQRCYEATVDAPGPCGTLLCATWTSIEACDVARRICEDRS